MIQIQNRRRAVKVLRFGAVDAHRRPRRPPQRPLGVLGVDLAADLEHGRYYFRVATVHHTQNINILVLLIFHLNY